MPAIDQTQLETTIQNDINGLTVSSSTHAILITAVNVAAATTDRKFFVACSADLPDLYTTSVTDGQIMFVNDIKTPVISSRDQWLGLDGRLLRNDAAVNTVWSWGCNGLGGQLGDNTTVNKSSPVSVVGGFADWCQASAGVNHTAAIRTNGSLWSWGCNNNGQLGDISTINKSSPVSAVGGFTDWCQVSAGTCHTAAVRTNGTIWTWGMGISGGQLGDNTTVNKSSPVSVVGGFTDWCQISAGFYRTAALRTNGTLWTWGFNAQGQLGDNTIVNKSSPVSVVGGFTDWCQVSVGWTNSAAIRTAGSLWAWGCNCYGQLGDNTTVSRSSPVSVVGGFTDWCQVSAGFSHIAAVRTNGTIWAWGWNVAGQLGDNNSVNKSSPVSVVGGFTDWCQVSAGSSNTAAIRTNGTLWTWGVNVCGRLGDNTLTNKSSPVSVVGGFTDWCQVSAGFCHTAAIRVCR